MSAYSRPLTVNGNLKGTYNSNDFAETNTTTLSNTSFVKSSGGVVTGSLSVTDSLGLSNTGAQNVTGIISATQYADLVNITPAYAASMTFNYNNGQCYYITPTAAITSVTLSNFPTQAQRSYVFTFILNTTNSAFLITATNVTVNSTTVPIYYSTAGTSATNLFVQTLYLINTSFSTTPSWKCLSSYSNYYNKICSIYKMTLCRNNHSRASFNNYYNQTGNSLIWFDCNDKMTLLNKCDNWNKRQ